MVTFELRHANAGLTPNLGVTSWHKETSFSLSVAGSLIYKDLWVAEGKTNLSNGGF